MTNTAAIVRAVSWVKWPSFAKVSMAAVTG
jgi:hypothetical protein